MKKSGFELILMCILLLSPTLVKANKEAYKKLSELKIVSEFDNAKVKIFKFADIFESEYSLDEKFENYPINCNNLEYADDYRNLAYTLTNYVKQDDIKADYEIKTNENGISNIKNLRDGVYLLIPEVVVKDNYAYVSESIILSLPYKNIDGTYDYSNTIYPKYAKLDNIEDNYDKEFDNIGSNKNYGNYRLNKVNVEMLKNNVLKKYLVLRRHSNWRSNIATKPVDYYDTIINDTYVKYVMYINFNKKIIINKDIDYLFNLISENLVKMI